MSNSVTVKELDQLKKELFVSIIRMLDDHGINAQAAYAIAESTSESFYGFIQMNVNTRIDGHGMNPIKLEGDYTPIKLSGEMKVLDLCPVCKMRTVSSPGAVSCEACVNDAARAVEEIGEDELERYAQSRDNSRVSQIQRLIVEKGISIFFSCLHDALENEILASRGKAGMTMGHLERLKFWLHWVNEGMKNAP